MFGRLGGKVITKGEPTLSDKKRKLNHLLKWDSNTPTVLMEKLEEMKKRIGFGYEVKVEWQPGKAKFRDGKPLEEEVIGNTIIIYSEDQSKAEKLLAHGFAEWLLNQNTKRYRLLINKLIELFEQIQYEEKEKIVDAVSKLISQVGDCKKIVRG
jgi:hypothetical protein